MSTFKPDACISAFIPLSTHVTPHVIKTREGDYMVTWFLDGLPFVCKEDWDIEHRHHTFNRLLQGLRAPDVNNLAFWVHDVRRARSIQMPASFKELFNQDVHDQYFGRLAAQNMMQNELYLTMIYRPVVSGRFFFSAARHYLSLKKEEDDAIRIIEEIANNLEAVLIDYAPYRLGIYENEKGALFSETLEFFSYLINRTDEPVPVLKAPIHDYLATSKHSFSKKIGDFIVTTANGEHRYGAVLNIKEYTDHTWPGILNGLKYLDCEYVITHSFSPMGRHAALKVLERTKGLMLSSGDRSSSQINELDGAMDQLVAGHFVLGEYHFTLSLFNDNYDELYRQLALVRSELSNAGFVSTKEELAVASAFYAQLPGNWKYRTRLANMSSLNFLGLSPLHNFGSGKRLNNPWGECVTVLQTVNGQPYYFNFHATHPTERSNGQAVLGNTMVIGQSGTGKTVLINFLLSQTQKYSDKPTLFFFDKDHASEIFIRACGGTYMSLELGKPSGLNPFACDNSEGNQQFLVRLVQVLAGKTVYSPSEEESVSRAVAAILDSPMALRTLANLQKSLPNTGEDSIFARLRKWVGTGHLAWLFDNPHDDLNLERSHIMGFDYTQVIDQPEIRTPLMSYLIHRLESIIDGRPVIYVMDEFWKILDGDSALKDFAKNKQKTIRKQNGLGIFATQSPEDALRSDIAAALVEQTATMILLPNPNADRSDYIDGLKLNEAEFEVVTQLSERSHCFLIKQGNTSAICQLNLRGMSDILAVLASKDENVHLMRQLLDNKGNSPESWLPDFYQQMT